MLFGGLTTSEKVVYLHLLSLGAEESLMELLSQQQWSAKLVFRDREDLLLLKEHQQKPLGVQVQSFLEAQWKNGNNRNNEVRERELFRVTLVKKCIWGSSVCPRLFDQPNGIVIMLTAKGHSVVRGEQGVGLAWQ